MYRFKAQIASCSRSIGKIRNDATVHGNPKMHVHE